MPLRTSSRFATALGSADQTRVVLCQVWDQGTAIADLGTVVAGSVNVDVTSAIRRTCSLTVVSQGLEYDDLVPSAKGSLLHPATGHELRLFRGFDYTPASATPWRTRLANNDGTVEVCPLGVFRMSKPVVKDTGDSLTIAISGNDRAALVSARKWRDVHVIPGGSDVRTAVLNVISDRLSDFGPNIYRLSATPGITVPATIFGTDLSGSNDPMADAITLATAASMELFFDPNGYLVMQPIPNPAVKAASFGAPNLYAEGVNCTVLDATRTLDESQTYNGVIVIGTGAGGAPVRAEVWDTDPASPTWVGGPWGHQPYIYPTTLIPASATSSTAVAQAQALKLAQSLFRQVRTMLDTPTIDIVPNPALLESDAIDIVRARIGLANKYTLAQMTMPLDVSSSQSLTARPSEVPIGAYRQQTFTPGTPSHGA